MTLHTIKIFALKTINRFCYDTKCPKALPFILTWGKIAYPFRWFSADFQLWKKSINFFKIYDLAFSMQGLLFCLKRHLAEYLTDGKTSLFFFLSFILLLIFPYSLSNGSTAWVVGVFFLVNFEKNSRKNKRKSLKKFEKK